MSEFIQYESVVTPVKNPLDIKTMYNRSVVFEFYGGIAPIACDLAYLYADDETHVNLAEVLNLDKEGPLSGFGNNNGLNTVILQKKYRFLDVIRFLIFKYGLKHEYYKNVFGQWIDVLAIRPYFGVKKYSDVIFSSWYTGNIDDRYYETSVYVKLCDDAHFNGGLTDGIMAQIMMDDLNKIPACKYIVKMPTSGDSDGKVCYIPKADGQYKLEKVCKYNFREINETNDVVSDDIIHFKYDLCDHNTGNIAVGNFKNNDHHKFDDLVLTFTDKDGNPFTDLDNLLISINGMIVDYERSSNYQHKIYINNVVRYADYQIKGLKEGYSLDNYSKMTEDNHGNKIINYEVPTEDLGYVWTFDIKINKWEGVSVSHFEEPLTNKSLLKSEPTEVNKSFWLTTGMTFSSEIDKEKCILICGNEIVSKDSWEVDEKDNHTVNLKGVSAEFDIIYSEMYRRIKLYTAMMINHTINDAPKITDFLKDHYESMEDVETAIQMYESAVEEYIENGGEYNYHYSRSALAVVKQQFVDRQYAIVKFDTTDNVKYDIEVCENHDELQFNTPYRDRMRNLNWSMDDIVVINGIVQKFVNEYADVFKPVAKWYLTDISNTLDDVNGYKLEVCKHYKSANRYLKLNYTQLSRGPISGNTYYTYDKENDQYIPTGDIYDFDKSFVKLTSVDRENGMERDVLYYTYDSIIDDYVKVPSTVTEFNEITTYYKLVFNKEYYLLKK